MSAAEKRSCPSYPGYSVTNLGVVYSHRTRRGVAGQHGGSTLVIAPEVCRLKAAKADRKGYLRVTLYVAGKKLPVGVHLLVLDAFKGPRQPGMEGRHLDGNNTNNSPDNLEWGTPQENVADRLRNGGYARGGSHHGAKLTDAQAIEVRRLRCEGSKVKALAQKFGVSVSTIEAVIYRRSY